MTLSVPDSYFDEERAMLQEAIENERREKVYMQDHFAKVQNQLAQQMAKQYQARAQQSQLANIAAQRYSGMSVAQQIGQPINFPPYVEESETCQTCGESYPISEKHQCSASLKDFLKTVL